MTGWIKLHRELMQNGIFQNEKLLKVFIYCLLKASHSDHTVMVGRQSVDLKPGQFVFGRKKASADLDMKESTVRDYMNVLKNDNTITMKSTNKYTIVTIDNWEIFQREENNYDNKTDSKQTNKKTTKRQQNTTYKNGNNDKNVKKEEERVSYGSHVTLTDEEKKSLNAEFGSPAVNRKIEWMNQYCTNQNKSYSNYHDMLLKWLRQDEPAKPKPTAIQTKKPKTEYEEQLNLKAVYEGRLAKGYEHYEERNQAELYEEEMQRLAEVNEWLGKQEGRNNDEQLRSYQLTGTH